MIPALLAIVTATGGDGVPGDAVERARRFVARALADAEGEVRLELFRTRAEMEAAVRARDRRAPVDFAAYYHYRSRTIFAYLAPRPDPALWRDGLTGLLLGALAHEAQHARGDLRSEDYRRRPAHEIEGEADRDAVRLLGSLDAPAAGAWRFQLESAVWRARARRMLDVDLARVDPAGLTRAQRRTWYAAAYALAGDETGPAAWVLWRGSAEPRRGGYRLISAPGRAAVVVREAPGPLDVVVTPLDAGKGQVEIVHGFRSMGRYGKIVFLRRGGVRAMWREGGRWSRDPLHDAPPLPPGRPVRIALRDGKVSCEGRVVLHVQSPRGKRGIGVYDGAAEFNVRP